MNISTFEMHLRELITINSIGAADDKYYNTFLKMDVQPIHKKDTKLHNILIYYIQENNLLGKDYFWFFGVFFGIIEVASEVYLINPD